MPVALARKVVVDRDRLIMVDEGTVTAATAKLARHP
jgi:isoaspartyl peptidase/L-asparaginase-like protein (Ntn-hydrolase superfamily)